MTGRGLRWAALLPACLLLQHCYISAVGVTCYDPTYPCPAGLYCDVTLHCAIPTPDGGSGATDGGSNPASWVWRGPIELPQGAASESDQPRLAYGQGKAWVAWQDFNSSTMTATVWLTNRSGSGSWVSPQPLPAVAGWAQGAFFPQIALASTGAPVVAFEELGATTGTYSIWAAWLTNGLTVPASNMVRLDSSSANTPQLGQGNALAVDAAGNAIVAWTENGGLFGSAAQNGGSWTSESELDDLTGQPCCNLNVTAGAAGQAMVGWSRDTTTAASPLQIGSGGFHVGSAEVLMTETNPPGAVVVLRGAHGLAVWPATNGLGWRTYDNGEWGAPSTISDSNLSYYVEPTLAMNDLGQAVLLWRDAGSTGAYAGTIQGSYFDGSAWSPPHTVSVPGAHATAWWQAVDINDVGTAVAAWADFESTGTYTRIWAGILDVGSGQPVWQAPVAIDMPSPNADLADEPQNVRDISVALDPAGSVAYVVYMQHADSPATTPFTWVNWLE